MPYCTYCGSQFSRDEHLERHILTHTQVKPHKCFFCKMSFARKDLLQRHSVVHGKDADQDEDENEACNPRFGDPFPRPNGRTPIACHNCAKNKTKCDKNFPCSRCTDKGLQCTARPTRRNTKNGAIMQRLEKRFLLYGGESSTSRDQSGSSSPVPVSNTTAPLDFSSYDTSYDPAEHYAATPSLDHSPRSHLSTSYATDSYATYQSRAQTGHISRRDQVHDIAAGPDGYAMPLPSPLLGEGQAMDWLSVPLQYDRDCGGELNGPSSADYNQNQYPNPFYGYSYDDTAQHPAPRDDFAMSVGSSLPSSSDLTSHNEVATSTITHDKLTTRMLPQPLQTVDPKIIEALAAAHDAWSVFRCNPCVQSADCPVTASLNIEMLERSLENHELWSSAIEEPVAQGQNDVEVADLQDTQRDKLLAITQSFLHKALNNHDGDLSPTDRKNSATNFVLLPPAHVLKLFLRAYSWSFERYYAITPKNKLDVSQIMTSTNDRSASLLILLMIAQGASAVPGEGQSLTAGLVEACRISLFDVVERNIMMAGDHVVLQSGLLFVVEGSWLGDKWLLDIASSQRCLYINMLKHTGRCDPGTPRRASQQTDEPHELWQGWIDQESRSRLLYAWVMVDQETSLFHDTPTMFQVNELAEHLPSSDAIWSSRTLEEWAQAFEQSYEYPTSSISIGPNSRPVSLRGLYRCFLEDTVVTKRVQTTALHLRLLLQPIQGMLFQTKQTLDSFPDRATIRRGSKGVSCTTLRTHLREIATLLQRWYTLADRHMKTKRMCATMHCSLIMYHLISLNMVTNFKEIEQLARREEGTTPDQSLPVLQKRSILDQETAVMHCGQVMRLVRSMSPTTRPPWWAASMYRVALILWAVSLFNVQGSSATAESCFAVDLVAPEDPLIEQYVAEKQVTPLLTKNDGSQMPITDPSSILLHCIQVIGEGVATRFSDALRFKLSRLAQDVSR